eukprot:m.24581 g.24581  ORF g.24581 m.24581 type:complete len:86 (-) comp9121_c0_seq2:198-455(-)
MYAILIPLFYFISIIQETPTTFKNIIINGIFIQIHLEEVQSVSRSQIHSTPARNTCKMLLEYLFVTMSGRHPKESDCTLFLVSVL